MAVRPHNRAVSAVFRVFGGEGKMDRSAEAWEKSSHPGMHEGERLFLAVFIPFSLFTVIGGELFGTFFGWWSWLPALPLAFIALNVLPFLFNVRTPLRQWRTFLLLFCGWSAWHLYTGRTGLHAFIAWGWLLLGGLNLLGCMVILLEQTFDWAGRRGILWRGSLLIALHVIAVLLGWHWAWYWGVAAGALVTLFYCYTVLRPGCQCLGPVRCRTDGREILITIDDGPDPRDTPALLDLLDRHHHKAVFFLIGEKVKAYPELAREILRRGHEIGNHTMTHPQASFWCGTPARTRREIVDCQNTIREITGASPKWFRAPVGHRNWFTHPVTQEQGLEIMGWSRRGFDAVEKNAEKVLNKILPKMEAGDIILLHEGTPIAAQVLEGVLRKTNPEVNPLVTRAG